MLVYELKTNETFNTTAIYPNRIYNKLDLEDCFSVIESGDLDTKFYSINKRLLLAEGYIRIVYGDHGPYFEFLKENIMLNNWEIERKGIGYYNKLYPSDGSNVLLYWQRKTVTDLKNPPKGKFSFNGNRENGYADYRINRFYISPYSHGLIIERNNNNIKKMVSLEGFLQ